MKRKFILSIVITVALTCLFALCVSAENIGGIEYTLNASNKTATFAASNRTDCTLTRVVIPETVVGADGETYTVTAIADRSIGHQDANAGNQYIEYLYIPKTVTSIPSLIAGNTKITKIPSTLFDQTIISSITDRNCYNMFSSAEFDTLTMI